MAKGHTLFQAALECHLARDLTAAEALYRKVLKRDPRHLDALNNLGLVLALLGRLDEAVASYRAALGVKADDVNALCNLASALCAQGRHDEAEGVCRRALARAPDDAALHNNLGGALHALGRSEEAAAVFARAVALDPGLVEAHANLGAVQKDEGRLEDAAAHFEAALACDSDQAEVHHRLGATYLELGRPEAAAARLSVALGLCPEDPEVHNDLALALLDQGRLEEAAAGLRRAIALRPGYAEAHVHLGNALEALGRFDEAMASYHHALAIAPDHAAAHWNRALAYLRHGDLARGWEGYAWREAAGVASFPATALPRWDGTPLNGRTLLVHSEQGVGDEIMFASCLAEMIDRAGRCIVTCDSRLVPLFRRSFPGAVVCAQAGDEGDQGSDPEPADVWAPAGDLPGFFRPNLTSFPGRRGYLVPDPRRVDGWRDRLEALGEGPKVGISWRGGRAARERRRRSIELDHWAPLVQVSGARFVNLQYGDCRQELAALAERCGVEVAAWDDADPLADLDGSAALIAALDLVISVDNATVHMAGALGVSVWTLLPFAADWRWLVGRRDSPWYPTMRLFRQPRSDDWSSVLDDVRRELAARVRERTVPRASGSTTRAAPPPQGAHEPAPRRRVAFLNDTSAWYHWGCTCTSTAIHEELLDRGFEVESVPITEVYGCAETPASLVDFDCDAFFARFRAANERILEKLAACDIVIVNGEGTLHGTAEPVRNLLYLAYAAKTRFAKDVHIINHSAYPENAARISDPLANALYKTVYEVADFVAVREPVSAELLQALGVAVTQSFDCLPLYLARHYPTPAKRRPDLVTVAGSVAWTNAALVALRRHLEELVSQGLKVRVLTGAKAYPAADDQAFVTALARSAAEGWEVVEARSVEAWLDAIAEARLFVSGRFHHSIAAACLGTPFVALNSTTPKVEALMQMLGGEPPLSFADPRLADALAERTHAVLDAPLAEEATGAVLDRLVELARTNFAGLDGRERP